MMPFSGFVLLLLFPDLKNAIGMKKQSSFLVFILQQYISMQEFILIPR